jgi:hypothetical protein
MAWAYRDAVWAQVIAGVDPDPANAGAIRDWAVSYSDAVRPYTLGTGYVNFQMQETGDRVRAMYGSNYDRLARIKGHYDQDTRSASTRTSLRTPKGLMWRRSLPFACANRRLLHSAFG